MATLVVPKRSLIFYEGAQFRSATSEELIQRQGAVSNFLALYEYQEKDINANGYYGRIPLPRLGTDLPNMFLFDAEIINVFASIWLPGTGGTTEVDIKWASPGSSTWTSIFTTTPKFTSTAANFARVDSFGTNPATTGVTAPVLDATQINRNAGDAFRMDILQAMTGDPVSVGVTIQYRPR